MASFDITKMWIAKDTNKYVVPSYEDIKSIANMVKTVYGGRLDMDTYFCLRKEDVKNVYTMVMIKDHLCAIILKLGEGAYGRVYKAYDLKVQKLVAVKSQALEISESIIKQAAVTKTVGIGLLDPEVNIGPSFLRDRRGYFILPLADFNFGNWIIRKTISGDNKVIVDALIKLAKDLVALHSAGKVHMDLKTDNVFIVDDTAYLGDFGKVEPEGRFIPKAEGDNRMYPQCGPEYFKTISPYYKVDRIYDSYSFGYFLICTAKAVRDKKLRQELVNIASYVHTECTRTRVGIPKVIEYLEALKRSLV
jgi:serine/threonine protein kinase